MFQCGWRVRFWKERPLVTDIQLFESVSARYLYQCISNSLMQLNSSDDFTLCLTLVGMHWSSTLKTGTIETSCHWDVIKVNLVAVRIIYGLRLNVLLPRRRCRRRLQVADIYRLRPSNCKGISWFLGIRRSLISASLNFDQKRQMSLNTRLHLESVCLFIGRLTLNIVRRCVARILLMSFKLHQLLKFTYFTKNTRDESFVWGWSYFLDEKSMCQTWMWI